MSSSVASLRKLSTSERGVSTKFTLLSFLSSLAFTAACESLAAANGSACLAPAGLGVVGCCPTARLGTLTRASSGHMAITSKIAAAAAPIEPIVQRMINLLFLVLFAMAEKLAASPAASPNSSTARSIASPRDSPWRVNCSSRSSKWSRSSSAICSRCAASSRSRRLSNDRYNSKSRSDIRVASSWRGVQAGSAEGSIPAISSRMHWA
jgi:hypothetical protein